MILSLENHCSQEQQEILAQYLTSILGEKLLSAPLDQPTDGNLPSPNVRLAEDAACRRGGGCYLFVGVKKKNLVVCLCEAKQGENETSQPSQRASLVSVPRTPVSLSSSGPTESRSLLASLFNLSESCGLM